MNLLITTLGTSWQIVPELFGVTNPKDYDFFCNSQSAVQFRESYNILPVDELWIITTQGQHDIEKLESWSNKWNCNLHIFVCKGVDKFQNENEIIKMRSFIYRIVLAGSQKADVLYLSLSLKLIYWKNDTLYYQLKKLMFCICLFLAEEKP